MLTTRSSAPRDPPYASSSAGRGLLPCCVRVRIPFISVEPSHGSKWLPGWTCCVASCRAACLRVSRLRRASLFRATNKRTTCTARASRRRDADTPESRRGPRQGGRHRRRSFARSLDVKVGARLHVPPVLFLVVARRIGASRRRAATLVQEVDVHVDIIVVVDAVERATNRRSRSSCASPPCR